MKDKLASVIIVSFNGKDFIGECIKSVLKQSLASDQYEVIVVDNASSDDSAEYISRTFPEVRLIRLDKNLGFGGGCNVGVDDALGKYVVLLNSDAIADKDWLKSLIERAENEDTKLGAINSKVMLDDGVHKNLVQTAGVVLFKNGYGRDRGALVKNHQQFYEEDSEYFDNTKVSLTAFSGASVLIPKAVYRKLKGFDEQFFMYYEDADLSLRMLRQGLHILYENKSIVFHKKSLSAKENSVFFDYHVERNRLFLLVKHFPISVILNELIRFVMLYGFTIIRLFTNKKWQSKLSYRSKVLLSFLLELPTLIWNRLMIDRNSTIDKYEIWRKLY